MKWDTKEPCTTCPYRRDSKIALWTEEEYKKLLANDANELTGAVFGCHQTRKSDEWSVCGGWLLDQINRGLPSIQLRMQLIRSNAARACVENISDGGRELYGSIKEMVRANYPELLEDR